MRRVVVSADGRSRERSASAPSAESRDAPYLDEQWCDSTSGGCAMSSMAQNGTDQSKSAENPNRVRFLSRRLKLIGPIGASPLPSGAPIAAGSKPPDVVA